ncbi:retron St85 family effector protein [Pseudonocardia sp. TMWB2A]|uniref:retron St85 family effector protein n=1 Tax=Pseudonocardia sp. TMWB2A TaxID=687430 RepID=UPI00307F11E5
MLFEFLAQLDLSDIRVRAPSKIILLCGGQMSNKHEDAPLSLRDVFFKIVDSPIPKDSTLFRAEDVNAFYIKSAKYDDLLKFENDLAQICELILLFCESEGSFSELGSFASNEEISSRTLVVIQDEFFNDEKSYIRLGPLQALLNDDDSAVVTYSKNQLGIVGTNVSNANRQALGALLKERIARRLSSIDRHTTLSILREGHAIKALVGFAQELGALQRDEMLLALQHIGIDINDDQLSRYILCAESVTWLRENRTGDRRLIFPNPKLEETATQFLVKKGGDLPTNALRRRAAILDYWQANDPERFYAIAEMKGKKWAA